MIENPTWQGEFFTQKTDFIGFGVLLMLNFAPSIL